ncbi:MAG TPA: alpha/beta hydrolase [Ramlibacter sp.]|nr:alpha/beta hydrolase [Ramlibacter sp.]
MSNENLRAPSLALLALEFRAPLEFGSLLPAMPVLSRAPSGDGHTVLVFPGLSASDATTVPLRGYLSSLGYDTGGWSQGFNFGPRAGVLETAKRGLTQAFQSSGRKVSLIGWSLGGVYARELAKEMPDLVRCVITLGAPFAGPPKSTNAWRIYELTSGRDIEREHGRFDLPMAPPQPTTSIYSRSDGIVAWQGSIQQPHHAHTENVEVVASHIGLGLNPSTWWVVADRLALPEGQWRPFDRNGLLGLKGLIYPDPKRD